MFDYKFEIFNLPPLKINQVVKTVLKWKLKWRVPDVPVIQNQKMGNHKLKATLLNYLTDSKEFPLNFEADPLENFISQWWFHTK